MGSRQVLPTRAARVCLGALDDTVERIQRVALATP
jgi:hypothetical protein